MNMEKKIRIMVIGDAMLDEYVYGSASRISPEAPVPVFLTNGKRSMVPGGAANVAVNIRAIGAEVNLIAAIGSDEAADYLISLLKEHRIDISGLVKMSNRVTTQKLRYIAQNNQQLLRIDTEDTECIRDEYVPDFFRELEFQDNDYSLIVVSDYKKGFLTEKVMETVRTYAQRKDIPILIDVKDTNVSKYQNATLLKPNKKELSLLTNMDVSNQESVIKASVKLCHMTKCKYVLTTLGADGMILVDQNGLIKEAKSVAREVYDVTGAGDTSIAYLALEIAKGRSVEDAMIIANYAAGIQVGKMGTSIVYPKEVENAIQSDGLSFDIYTYGIEENKKNSKPRIVFTNGCFDILHSGHVKYLSEARRLGDKLIVGINSDASVRRLKGDERPVNTLADRMMVLKALSFVDEVIAFDEDTPERLIRELQPDVLVKGGDYKPQDIVGNDFVKKNGGEVVVIPFVEGKSTTSMINRIRQNEK